MDKLNILFDDNDNKIVVIPEVIFKNKQNIEWSEVESFLLKYVGDIVEIIETKDRIHLGNELPDEYANSKYSRFLKGARAKAKANAVQGIREMVEIAENKIFSENEKTKHVGKAGKGWYYYTTRFALPVYKNEQKTEDYSVYSARLVVNHAKNGKKYLYDLVDIKKKRVTHSRLEISQVVKNRFL